MHRAVSQLVNKMRAGEVALRELLSDLTHRRMSAWVDSK